VPTEPSASYAAGLGAARGAAAGVVYGLAVAVALLVQDWHDARQGEVAPVSWSDVPPALLIGLLLFGGLAAPVGAAGGALLGLAVLPVARTLPPLRAAVVCGAAVAVLGTVAFPFVPLGRPAEDLGSFLVLSVLPGAVAGAAAAWHAATLSRLGREAWPQPDPSRAAR
jgi:hypothetical protein